MKSFVQVADGIVVNLYHLSAVAVSDDGERVSFCLQSGASVVADRSELTTEGKQLLLGRVPA